MIKIIRINGVIIRFDTITGEGLKQLYEVLKPKIEGIAFKVYIDGYDKEDLRQEVRVIIWKATKAYRPGKGKYLTWIIGCIDNRVKSLISNSKRFKDVQLNTNNEEYKLSNIPESLVKPVSVIDTLKNGEYKLSKADRLVLNARLANIPITTIQRKYYKGLCYETVRQRIIEVLKIAGNNIV